MQPSLDHLAASVQHELELLDYPRRDWLAPRRTTAGVPVHDVIIVGAGQGGLSAAFGLLRERVTNLLVIDENPLDRAGPWLNFARMRTLRTPKHVVGPDLGVPSLTPRAWWEAQHGPGSWDALGLIPKESWAAYLAWYRRTLGIPVRSDTRVGALSYDALERCWRVPCTGPTGDETLFARRVVLATGIDGSGQWEIPELLRAHLPARLYAHTRAAIDFEALAGKRVAVLGAGASAFDNAAVALEHGAREVRLFFRRKKLVNVNAYRWAEFVGFLKHHADLPDADKWRFILQILRLGQLPPADTLRRASEHPSFHLHPGSSWRTVEARGDQVLIRTDDATFEVDFIIVGTGFVTDLSLRPELTHVEPLIARWADRFTPPDDERHQDLERHPYLGTSFEFTEREPGRAPYLQYLHNYTFGGLVSLGFGGASISGMKYSNPRLVGGITKSLFVEDSAVHLRSLEAYAEEEFLTEREPQRGRFGLRSTRVVTPTGVREATVLIDDGRIEAVTEGPTPGVAVTDLGASVLSPGIVDCHVHVNEPGRTEWEGFATATRAAAAGGVTSLVDMPLNSEPVTTDQRALVAKQSASRGQCFVDVGFWGGVVPGNATALGGLAEAGALGCKAFLVDSGIDSFPRSTEEDLRRAMPVLRDLGLPLLAHAELDLGAEPGERRGYGAYLASRPPAWEDAAIQLLLELCEQTRCHVHIVHLSSAQSLPALRRAKERGLPVTVETCPHYLCFDAESIPDDATEYKCSPPIRERDNREKLWEGLLSGLIDFVITDHSPCVPALKLREQGDFMAAWGGIASLGLGLPAVWTEAVRRGATLDAMARWMSAGPAAFAGLGAKKGRLAPGCDADFVVWEPEEPFCVEAEALFMRHRLTPYLGRTLYGRVRETWLRGRRIFDGARHEAGAIGELLLHRQVAA